MSEWTKVEPFSPHQPFPASSLCAGIGVGRSQIVGVEVENSEGHRFLIGDCNALGGICDDCTEDFGTIVRWRRLAR